jgi:protein-S-isoprenylcysteine O-methyltransferase Ste14
MAPRRRRSVIELKPTRIAVFYLITALALHYLFGLRLALPLPYPLAGGIVLAAIGFAVMIWAWAFFEKCKTPIRPVDRPSALVTAGPYRFTRNPMYLGMALMLLGAAYFLRGALMFLAPLLFVLTMNGFFIPHEEGMMEDVFGGEFADYKRRVRRWL